MTTISYWHASSRPQLNWLKDYVFIIWISGTIPPVRPNKIVCASPVTSEKKLG